MLTNRTCESINTASTEQDSFFSGTWDAHHVGWLISGVTALVATLISVFTIYMHGRNYHVPKQQKQIIRILGMPAVYAIISFFSYRYFREYTYYQLVVVVYEALVLAAFLYLIFQYAGNTPEEQRTVLQTKEKQKIVFPFCCWRYRPSKPYFMFAVKWSVLQYSYIRPIISIIGIICNATGKLCPTQYSVYFAEVYLDSFDCVSISIALYGLIIVYQLLKEELQGHKPLFKFLSIKGIVFFTFYQGFVFSILEAHGVIKATEYWTADNVADGLQALTTCCEMVIFSVIFVFAFSWKDYARLGKEHNLKHTNPFKAFLGSLNYMDFVWEGYLGLVFLYEYITGRQGTSSKHKSEFDLYEVYQKASSYGKEAFAHDEKDQNIPLNSYSNIEPTAL